MDRIMALVAYAVLAAFLIILVWHVPRFDLGGVVLLTLVFAGFDAAAVMRSHRKSGHVAGDDAQRP
ncbi:hypothetical protein J7376_08200 [Paracoccus sp. R12_1]|jgi:hypothetical protein|uniref:hypothetical protein n=1 Tax=unclassified Paracoccus (in: a-proteobacteria) TaxID=2688777 RepID=UPI001AD9F2AB|nr:MULTISPECIES: hypothetical protein [unclassified Paracoccus (in: a-proteobacteria)]MBO9455133.1 hypothetical protein [Paracoccus sp. R12_2]MBO9486495.1 hypothetical protein [Paracoccus sp. R12_1]